MDFGGRCLVCPIIPSVPPGEGAEAVAEGGGGAEAEVAFEGCCVGEGDGNVAWLHGHEFFVRLEVVIGWEYTCSDEFFLKDGDEVEQVFR